MVMILLLSTRKGVGGMAGEWNSVINLLRKMISWMEWDATMYSASEVVREIVVCSIEEQCIGDPRDVNRDTEVYFIRAD